MNNVSDEFNRCAAELVEKLTIAERAALRAVLSRQPSLTPKEKYMSEPEFYLRIQDMIRDLSPQQRSYVFQVVATMATMAMDAKCKLMPSVGISDECPFSRN